ncbi:MAG TPA: pentapeptide repeat-containing protein, partial [Acetobacteraceae bacterium]
MDRRSSCAVALLGLMLLVRPAWAAALTRADVTEALARASPDHKADFAGQSLEKADLSGLDLAGVDFAGADLRNANLSDANLSGANLRGALMDL